MSGAINTMTGQSGVPGNQPVTPDQPSISQGSDHQAADEVFTEQSAAAGNLPQVGSDVGALTSEVPQEGGTGALQATGPQPGTPETAGGNGGPSNMGGASNTRQPAGGFPGLERGSPTVNVASLRRSYEPTSAGGSGGPLRRFPPSTPEAQVGGGFLEVQDPRQRRSFDSQNSRPPTPTINQPSPNTSPALSSGSQDRNQLGHALTATSGGPPPQARWRSGIPEAGSTEVRHYGNIPAGEHLQIEGNREYAHTGRNDGQISSSRGAATTRLETNNKTSNIDENQAGMQGRGRGHFITGTNHGEQLVNRNAGNVTLGSNDGYYESRDAEPGARENIISHNHEMKIVGSQAQTHIGSVAGNIHLGEPATDGRPAQPGLIGDGKLTSDSFRNGSVEHTVLDSPLKVAYRKYITNRSDTPDGPTYHQEVYKPDKSGRLEVNKYGRPGVLSPAATFKAGEGFKTYLTDPYNTLGAFGIYFANATGSAGAPTNTDHALHPPASASATPTATSTATESAGSAAGQIRGRPGLHASASTTATSATPKAPEIRGKF